MFLQVKLVFIQFLEAQTTEPFVFHLLVNRVSLQSDRFLTTLMNQSWSQVEVHLNLGMVQFGNLQRRTRLKRSLLVMEKLQVKERRSCSKSVSKGFCRSGSSFSSSYPKICWQSTSRHTFCFALQSLRINVEIVRINSVGCGLKKVSSLTISRRDRFKMATVYCCRKETIRFCKLVFDFRNDILIASPLASKFVFLQTSSLVLCLSFFPLGESSAPIWSTTSDFSMMLLFFEAQLQSSKAKVVRNIER